MALLFIDGFDHYDDANYKYNDVPGTMTNMEFVTGRFGDYAFGTKTSGNSDGATRNLDVTSTELYVGFAWYGTILNQASVTEFLLRLRNSTDGVAHNIRWGASGEVQICSSGSGTVLAQSSAGAVSAAKWQFIEVYYKPLTSGGVTTVWVDNTQVVTYTGNNTVTVEAVDAIQILPTISNSGQSPIYVDDLYVLNTTGTVNISRLGDCRVITLPANADTTRNDFTPLTGTDNYAMVDEVPIIDDDTSYVENGTVGAIDRYTSDTLTSNATYTSGAVLHGIQNTVCAKKTDTATRKYKSSLSSGTTLKEDGIEHALSTTYFCDVDLYDVDPNTSAAWTEAAIDAVKFGFKLTTVV